MQGLENLRETTRIQWKKWFRRDNLIVLVLSGILLFVIALPTKNETDKNEKYAGENRKLTDIYRQGDTPGNDGTADAGNAAGDGRSREEWENYAAEQEKRLEEILSVMEGIGRVKVMLTFSATEELVVEKEMPTVRSNTNETDSAGGSRIAASYDKGDSTVYQTVGGNSEPYVIKTLFPRVEGVLVVAEGAENANIRKVVTQIAEALFGVEAHKVVVVSMETEDG